ncbi:unnamed protein product [Sphagnum jensenii]|uniref:IPT/TIG domain-containing protein n=1 Tax=Sphagnum jensenii TaxID=128206 RepID=A0ABP0V6W2_9BRYO
MIRSLQIAILSTPWYYVYRLSLAQEGMSIDTTLMDNTYLALYGQPLPYAQIISETSNCNTDPAALTEITYSARNLQYTTNSGHTIMEFDVFATDTPANLLYSQSQIFIQYDSTIFGTYLVGTNRVAASKGMAVDSPYYNLSLSDSMANMLKINITHTPNPSSLANLDSVNQQLCHLKIDLTGFNLTTVGAAYDSILMAGKSMYQETVSGLEFPYDIVRVSGAFSGVRRSADNLTYQLALDTITYPAASNYYANLSITFDIQVSSTSSDYLYNAHPVISYSTDAFGTYICQNNYLVCTSTATSAYNFFLPGDVNSGAFQINLDANIDSGMYDITNSPDSIFQPAGYPLSIATCTLTLQNCCASEDLSINRTSTAYYAYPDSTGVDVPYQYSITAGAGIDTAVSCSNFAPRIINFSPTIITAGTFDTLTINGIGFGCTPGQVYFSNTEGAYPFISRTPDIISWQDNQVTLIVASCHDNYFDDYIPGTGPIQVFVARGGGSAPSSDALLIPYAVLNDRLPSGRAIRVGLWGADSAANHGLIQHPEYTFIPDATITANPPAQATITHAMNDWVCETGVRFIMAASGTTLGYASLLGFARHEFGHGIGLRHILNYNDLLYPTSGPDTCKVIHYDDQSGGLYELNTVAPYLRLGNCWTPNPGISGFGSLSCRSSTNGLTDLSTDNHVIAYPNPFDNSITIKAEIGSPGQVRIEIIDLIGQLALTEDYGIVSDSHFQREINTAGFTNGETVSGLEFPYDIVRVSGLVGSVQSTELAYDLTGFSTTVSPGNLAFYVTVRSQPPSSFSDGQVIIDYDTLAFGTSIASTTSYYGLSYNDAYTISDYSPYQLLININNVTSQTVFDQLSNTPDSLFILYLPVADCTQTADVGIDQGTDTLRSDYYDSYSSGTVTYDPIDALFGSDGNVICPNLHLW